MSSGESAVKNGKLSCEDAKLMREVTDNLKNLIEVMAFLEQKEDGSLYSLMKSNLQSDMEKLEKVMEMGT